MARPTKQGIDYFPLDCNNDPKIELYIAEAGIESFGILISLWQMIYRDNGYYVVFDDDLILLLRKHTLSSTTTIDNAINKAISRDLFSLKLFKTHKILTSHGIQKRYFDAAKRKKTVNVESSFLLVDVSEYINGDNVYINVVNGCKNTTKVDVDVKVDVNVKENFFEKFWILYNKKTDKKKCWSKFKKLKQHDIDIIFDTLPQYIESTPDVKYRKNPLTYLHSESWNDEIKTGTGDDEKWTKIFDLAEKNSKTA